MTLFGLGMVVVLIGVVGLGLDLLRVYDQRRELFELTDSAATAGANALSVDSVRADGTVVLDPALAEQWAWQNLEIQDPPAGLTSRPVVAATTESVTVTARAEVDFTLLAILVPGDPMVMTARSEARPRASVPD